MQAECWLECACQCCCSHCHSLCTLLPAACSRLDYILQKEAKRSVARASKRRGGGATLHADAADGKVGSGSGAVARGQPATAAASALHAFARVVELCTSATCRRAALLSHFGEAPRTPRPARCCDVCDSPAAAAATAAALRDAQQVEGWRSRSGSGGRGGSKRRRREDWGLDDGGLAEWAAGCGSDSGNDTRSDTSNGSGPAGESCC
jgi:RecQ zinc-binding